MNKEMKQAMILTVGLLVGMVEAWVAYFAWLWLGKPDQFNDPFGVLVASTVMTTLAIACCFACAIPDDPKYRGP